MIQATSTKMAYLAFFDFFLRRWVEALLCVDDLGGSSRVDD